MSLESEPQLNDQLLDNFNMSHDILKLGGADYNFLKGHTKEPRSSVTELSGGDHRHASVGRHSQDSLGKQPPAISNKRSQNIRVINDDSGLSQ